MPRGESETLSRPFLRAEARAQTRVCDHPGCEEEGCYRAPRSRDRLREYYWFCLDHVRSYNKEWDYFAGMSESEIEAERRRDTTWQRPSWPFGGVGQGRYTDATSDFRDDFGFFSQDKADEERARHQWERRRGHRRTDEPGKEDQALAELELERPITLEAIKARYKELVKRLHPDVNGGDRTQEDKLKAVNRAYATLRKAYSR